MRKNLEIFYKQFKEDTMSDIADTRPSLIKLAEEFEHCLICPLGNNRVNIKGGIAFGHGSLRPSYMFIGEGPSDYESSLMQPFSDKRNRTLQGLVTYLEKGTPGFSGVYVTNLVLCPGGVIESTAQACRGRLEAEIGFVRPKILILLGASAAQIFLGTDKSLEELRKKPEFITLNGELYTVYTLHSLRDLFFRRDETRMLFKEDLDRIMEHQKEDQDAIAKY